MLTVFFAIDLIMPFHRQFSVEDKSLMYAFTEHETVPAWSLVVSYPLTAIYIHRSSAEYPKFILANMSIGTCSSYWHHIYTFSKEYS